jgi:AmiR/NasT family two-component response regulator
LSRKRFADDQAMVREGFAAVLAAQPGLLVVGQAADGADAVSQTRQLDLDVVLMDVRMPVMDGASCHPPDPRHRARPARAAGADAYHLRPRWLESIAR